jgi:hypothetical protein
MPFLANLPYDIGRAARLSGTLLQMTKCIHFCQKLAAAMPPPPVMSFISTGNR